MRPPVLSLAIWVLAHEASGAALRKAPEFATVVTPRTVLDNSYDFIIAGGGISGLTVADRLSEDPSIKVLVIEAGIFDQDEDNILIPGQFFTPFPFQYMYLPLPSVPQTALNNRSFNIPAGKVVGGGSVLNAMVYSENFTAPDPAYAAAANFSFDPSVHGTTGPVQASFPSFHFEGSGIWFDAAISSGLRAGGDPHAGDGAGVVYVPSVTSGTTRTRSHARLNHYTRVQPRSNYHILAGHTVARVLFDNTKKVTGVEYLPTGGGERLTVQATKEVLLAGGAVHTPQILQLSGVGPKKVLNKFSIPIVADLPGVGANLHDQPSIIIPYNGTLTNNISPNVGTLNSDPVYDAEQRALYDATRQGPYQLTRGLSTNLALPPLCNATSNCKSIVSAARRTNPFKYLPEDTHPTVKAGYALQREIILRQLEGSKTPVAMIQWDTANSVRMYFLKPLSRGTVKIGSTNPLEWPLIDFRTNVDPIDEDLTVASFLKNRHIMSQPSMAALNPLEAAPFSNDITDKEVIKQILRGVTEPSSAHQCCTAAMVPRLLGGVVDPKMKVYGVRGLRVIDTSYWPVVLTAAPTATTYASGEKIADAIKAEYGLQSL
ncbi:putative GMC oxidoreductase [Triangularia verruculosa]|uniref:GMC oxidoreductase n=1 Tax=Triangularia verruculosa TaxID=2587418 RepID=A0AAN7AXP4_9PEZI|nr:putative GMC oxidoreductase [Triangularia verruculosa]